MAADDHQAQLRAAVLFRLDAHHGIVHDVDGDSQERRLEDDSGASGLSKEWSTGKLARERGLQARQLDPKKSLLAHTKPSSCFLPRMVLTHKKRRLCHL